MWAFYVVTAELMVVTLFTINSIYQPTKRLNETQILIIGAGPSGIAAATRLLENGAKNIVILEAENRIGGRMHTIKLDDKALELGCQWVHGEKGNAVFNLVKDLDLLINSSVGSDERKISFIEESGNLIDPEIASKYFEVLEEISESTADLENYTASVGDYFDEEYPKRLQELSLKDTFLSKIFLNWYHKASNSYHACDSWYDLSGHGLWKYKECDGKQNWAWKNGYSSFLDVLMKKFPDPSKELPVREKIQLNTEVKRIVWANLPEENNGRVIVESSDGSTYVADHVILTVSLGVLKERVNSMFSPELPTKKQNAIKGWNLGSVDKIYLKFPYKWWPKDFEEFAFLSSHEVTPCRRKDCWMKDLIEFHAVDNHPLLLEGWISGPAARQMEQLSDEEVKNECVKMIQSFVGKAFNISIPQPDLIIRSSWYSNPHFRGSWSFKSMETEKLGMSAAHLAEPLANEDGLSVLLFAGEATHSSYYSTVHGAVESGWREADRILRIYES